MGKHRPKKVRELKLYQGVTATIPLTFQENKDLDRQRKYFHFKNTLSNLKNEGHQNMDVLFKACFLITFSFQAKLMLFYRPQYAFLLHFFQIIRYQSLNTKYQHPLKFLNLVKKNSENLKRWNTTIIFNVSIKFVFQKTGIASSVFD